MDKRGILNKKTKKTIIAILLLLSFVYLIYEAKSIPKDITPQRGESNNSSEDVVPNVTSKTDDNAVKQNDEIDITISNSNEDWKLVLVNKENPLPENFTPRLAKLENGLEFDERAIGYLEMMLSDAKRQGLSPVVCSAYRSPEYQQELFKHEVENELSNGMNGEEAELEASTSIVYPLTSEHNLGLAVDIVSLDYQLLDDKQADTPEMRWLIEHCSEYGFILRYPKGKMHITGVIYEPWHFRYVGTDAAKKIMDEGITLEEYLEMY